MLHGNRGSIGIRRLNPAGVYVVLALLFGLAFVFLNPPCGTADEPSHFLRVFRLSQGGLYHASQVKVPSFDRYCQLCDDVGVANYPSDMGSDLKKFLGAPAPRQYDEELSSSYPPVPYLPAALSFKLVAWLHPSLAVYLYLGRLVTFLVSLLITWYAIRIIPTGKWIVVVLALMPMRLYQMASLSADSLTTALTTLWIALVLTMLLDSGSRLGKWLGLALATAVVLVLSKPMNAFLLLLVLAVPFYRYGRFASVAKVAVVGILFLAGAGVSYTLATHYAVPASPAGNHGTSAGAAAGGGLEMASDPFFTAKADEKAQAALLLNEPGRLYSVLKNGYQQFGKAIARGTIGDLGWHNALLPNVAIQCASVLLLLSIAMNGPLESGLRFRGTALLIFSGMLLLIPLALYLYWTPVGGDVFLGVSGRYFIPYLPLAFLGVAVTVHHAGFHWWAERLLCIGLTVCLISGLVTLWKTYYCIPPTAGVLRLTARSSANGTAMLATSRDRVFKTEGRYNLIVSDEPLQYEFRLQAGALNGLTLSVNSPYPLSFEILRAEILGLDGTLLKSVELEQLKLLTRSPEGKQEFAKNYSGGTVTLTKQQNAVFIGDLGVVLYTLQAER